MGLKLKKVLISDNVDPKCREILSCNGIEVVCKYNLSEQDIIKELETCDGLIVRSATKVTKNIIDSAEHLKIIGRAGTGLDNIDTKAAKEKGVVVVNTPNANSLSACELTCSLITCIARNVPICCLSIKEGRWDRKAFEGGTELFGKTLAVIGLGNIGKEIALRMKHFGMKIIGYDPFVSEEKANLFHVEKKELNEIWPIADYITVHTPLIPETKDLINETVLNKCKRGVKIINVARGGIVNELDLLKALKDGRCGGAALDVYTEEPPKTNSLLELIQHPKVIATPHVGASTKEAQIRVAVEVAERIVSSTR